jgi:hypothetical protein
MYGADVLTIPSHHHFPFLVVVVTPGSSVFNKVRAPPILWCRSICSDPCGAGAETRADGFRYRDAPSSLVPENHEAQLHVSGDVHEESTQSMSNSTYHMELLRPACKKIAPGSDSMKCLIQMFGN